MGGRRAAQCPSRIVPQQEHARRSCRPRDRGEPRRQTFLAGTDMRPSTFAEYLADCLAGSDRRFGTPIILALALALIGGVVFGLVLLP